MNFLAHYIVAERVAQSDDISSSPPFFVGVALPDLLGAGGEGRLRAVHLAGTENSPLVRGAALHLATDKRFHGLASFADAQKEASELLRAAPFSFVPRRVFFLAHILVEIAFDGYLLQTRPDLANDFYAPFEQADLVAVVEETQTLLHSPYPLFALARTLEGFLRSRYLRHYNTGDGQAEALSRVCGRVGLPTFNGAADREHLASVMEAFAPRCEKWADDFLMPPV